MLLTEAEAWADFYLVAGASAAVLIGLLFVALSINREAVAVHAHFRGQARQAIYALVYVFVISLVVLIPDQADWALGAELLCGALLNLVVAIPRQVRGMTTTPPAARRKFALVIAVYNGAMFLIMAAGTGLIAGFDGALFFLAAAVIALSLLAIANSWTLTLISTEPGGDN
jgi:hypothetical protein